MKKTRPHSASSDIREELLNATEELVAKYGVSGASVRRVIEKAKANLGAVNYHFGAKDHLIAETILRRLRPIDQERLKRLNAVEDAAGDQPLLLEEVLEAFIGPLLDPGGDKAGQENSIRLLGRAFQEPDPAVQAIMNGALTEVIARFNAAFRRALPPMPEDQLHWRVMITIASMHRALELWVNPASEGLPHPRTVSSENVDSDEFIRQIVVFGAAGLRALCKESSGS